MMDEAQAYLLHTPDPRFFNAALVGLAEADVARLRDTLSDDYVHVHTSGVVETLEAYVAGAAKGDRVIAPRALQIRVHGDCAVVVGPLVMTIRGANGERVLNMICTQTACRSEDGWRFVSTQATLLRPE